MSRSPKQDQVGRTWLQYLTQMGAPRDPGPRWMDGTWKEFGRRSGTSAKESRRACLELRDAGVCRLERLANGRIRVHWFDEEGRDLALKLDFVARGGVL